MNQSDKTVTVTSSTKGIASNIGQSYKISHYSAGEFVRDTCQIVEKAYEWVQSGIPLLQIWNVVSRVLALEFQILLTLLRLRADCWARYETYARMDKDNIETPRDGHGTNDEIAVP